MAKKNQPLRWHGGKFYLAKWLHSYAPTGYTHRVIPYGGGLAEFWHWPCEGIDEVINDIDHELMNFWAVLADKACFAELAEMLAIAPMSEPLWEQAARSIPELASDVERAYAFFVLYRPSRQGLGNSFATLSRTRTRRGMNEQVSQWLGAIEGLPEAHDRLSRVVILNRPALEVIKQQDNPDTFFYLDPPYLHDTRTAKDAYRHEMTEYDHRALLDELCDIQGKFMLSGYDNTLYRVYEQTLNWTRRTKEIDNKASSKKTKDIKIECIWMNYDPTGQVQNRLTADDLQVPAQQLPAHALDPLKHRERAAALRAAEAAQGQ